jgi:hypothetical protein
MSAEAARTVPPTAAPFLRAVAHQVTYALGADPAGQDTGAHESAAEQRALALLRDAGAFGEAEIPPLDDVARRLLAEPAMLAAFFQNLDLLFEHRAPGANAVSLLLMRAMEL